MNILLIKGSPHPHGSSNRLSDSFLRGAEAAGHHTDVFGVRSIAHPLGNRPEAQQNDRHKGQPNAAHSNERGGIDAQGLSLALFIDEAKEGGLHAEREQHEQQCHVTIYFGHDAITARFYRQFGGIERHKQIVEKAAHDTTQAVYHGVLHQGFQSSHILRGFVLLVSTHKGKKNKVTAAASRLLFQATAAVCHRIATYSY